jgi:hypothetical protein
VIKGRAIRPSHGSEDMPACGPLFSSTSHGHQTQVQHRSSNLVASIDAPAGKLRQRRSPRVVYAPGCGLTRSGASANHCQTIIGVHIRVHSLAAEGTGLPSAAARCNRPVVNVLLPLGRSASDFSTLVARA